MKNKLNCVEMKYQSAKKIQEQLKDYIFSYYDSYLYLKNFDDKLWVSVEGAYLTLDTLESPQQFLFHWVAIIDEQEAITDSSQALRQNTKEQNNGRK